MNNKTFIRQCNICMEELKSTDPLKGIRRLKYLEAMFQGSRKDDHDCQQLMKQLWELEHAKVERNRCEA